MSLVPPPDVTRALADLDLVATGGRGPSGGWVARDPSGRVCELVVREGVPDEVACRAASCDEAACEGRTADAASRLTALRHDHLVAVRAVVTLSGGRCGLLVVPGPLPTLAAVREARVPLTDAEAATVVIPLAQAMDALHAAGLAYGPVEAADVLLTGDGMPVLAAPARPWGAPDEDVPGLLTAVLSVMAPRTVVLAWGRDDPAGGLREAFEALVAAGCRSGDEVVRACLAATAPEPIRIPAGVGGGDRHPPFPAPSPVVGRVPRASSPSPAVDGVPGIVGSRWREPRPTRAGRRLLGGVAPWPGAGDGARGAVTPLGRGAARRAVRRRRRTGGVVGAVLAGVLVTVLAGVLLRPGTGAAAPSVVDVAAGVAGAPATAPSVGASPAGGVAQGVADPVRDRDDPVAAGAALTRLRAAALGSGDPVALDAVDAAGGPAREDDGRLLAGLAGSRVEGLGADVQDARLAGASSGDGGSGSGGDAGAVDDSAGPGDDGEATVLVTSAMTPCTLVGADGARTAVPGTTPRTAALTLRWTAEGWRVWRVSPAT